METGGGDRRDPGTIHQEGSPGSQAGGVRYGQALKSDGGKARGPDGGNQGRSRAAEAVGGTPGIGPTTKDGHGMSLVPPRAVTEETLAVWAVGSATLARDCGPVRSFPRAA